MRPSPLHSGLFVTLCILGAAALSAFSPVSADPVNHIDVLAACMLGSFSSAAQAEADTNYFDIRLEMVPIPSDDGKRWIYVEQATAAGLGTRPYRQRVYRLAHVPGTGYVSHVYTLPGDPLRFAGAFSDPDLLASIPLDSLTLLDGCSIELVYEDALFIGSTGERSCLNAWGDASYATSEVRISSDRLTSWDRGYNDAGEQVWGATEGPYIFEKISRYRVPAAWQATEE